MSHLPNFPREGLATVKDAAAFLHISSRQVYFLMAEGRITYAQIGGVRRIPWIALHAFLEANLVFGQNK